MTADHTTNPLKVFHGPVNIAGIGGYLARWQRVERGAVADFIVYRDSTPHQNHDLNLRLDSYRSPIPTILRVILFLLGLFKYKLFHFYYGISFLPFNLDLPLLRLFGKKVIMTYCGSEARLLSVEEKRNPYHCFLRVSTNDPKYDRSKRRMMAWQRIWVNRFIAARNLYASAREVIPERQLIHDIWINNVTDLTAFPPCYDPNEIPLVVHAPTSPQIKGTEQIEAAIEELKRRGVQFRYQRIENVPNQVARQMYREADIVVDQILLGGFGSLAVESMALGKPVCCYLVDEVKEQFFPDCPIVNVTMDNLADRLEELIRRPEKRVQIGREGRCFVERHCEMNDVLDRLWRVYEEVCGIAPTTPERPARAAASEDEPLREPPTNHL